MHFNFAPAVDINTNPKNPIIGNRSFGEDRDNVTEKGLAFMKGMQSSGTLANAKHFPGHGDTEEDSHLKLPTINFSAKRIDSIELYPYKKLIKQGLASVMVAHLNVPSLEARKGFPSSLSKHIVTDILKEDINLDRSSIGLLKQFSDKDTFLDLDLLAKTIKSVPIILQSAEELEKAISSLGGISLDEIDENFQCKKISNTYAIGEMLDWYGPTGGYLLQGSFSMGFVLAKHLNELEE